MEPLISLDLNLNHPVNFHTRNASRNKPFEVLPPGPAFPMNYSTARRDNNALYATNKVFGKEVIAAVRSKYHRSPLSLDALKEGLMKYEVPRVGRSHTNAYYMVLESVRRDLGLHDADLKPLTHGAVIQSPEVPNQKSPGLPYKLEGFKSKSDALADSRVCSEISQQWYDIEANKDTICPDAMCFARAQISTRDKTKIRPTWGYPLMMYIQEAAYVYPILRFLNKKPSRLLAYGLEMNRGGMAYLNSIKDTHPQSTTFMGDWSSFDTTVPAWIIRDAFRLLSEAFDLSHVESSDGVVWPVREQRSKRRWNRIIAYFIDTPIRLSTGERFIKHGGIPSGSCFTNIIDTIVNAIMVRYLIYNITGELPIEDVYMGDDSIAFVRHPFSLDTFASLAREQFGMNLNISKSLLSNRSDSIQFLGYYNNSGTPTKVLDTILASTVYPERTVIDPVETVARMIGQVYTCFDPQDAKSFLRCADMLREERQLSTDDIEKIIHDNPLRFKFLMTIGVDPTTIAYPKHSIDVPFLGTQVQTQHRKYTPRTTYDLEHLFFYGVRRFGDTSA
uniref:RdRp n=1 Tax=Wenling partiti-like virus 1 TaxID=1923515 RepID=A0A1L3KLR0_9VIRU|nr:RdRp [Wenling partiti-like virus 1]